ncbi:UNVERIFIED_CONTAM: DUF2335 domain-containing protein [Methylobacteriaceae bacterium AG10]|nr:DUF2335 domain-containing protein [Methylobacteriaceae bacterium AG10]
MRKPRRTKTPARQAGPTDQGKADPLREASVVIERGAYWRGPLPPPAVIEEFRELVPDAPERIFRQWEGESEHRRAYEKAALEASIRRDLIGQISATLFALSALAVAVVALWMGEPWVAGVIGGGTIVSVVGAFLYRRGPDRTKDEASDRPQTKPRR